MNYTKLTIAVTVGILLAATIIAAVIEIPEYLREQRMRERFARVEQAAATQACLDQGCPEGAYAEALKTAKRDPSSIGVTARGYCTKTAWHGASPERQITLQAQCEADTRKRLADDLK